MGSALTDRLVVMRVYEVVVKKQQKKVRGGQKGDLVPIICAVSSLEDKHGY
jgi:hypothetical protein